MTMSTVAHPSPPRYVQKTSHSTPWTHVDSVPTLVICTNEAVGAIVGSALGFEEDGSEDGFSEGSDEGLDEGGAVVGCAVGSPFLGVGRNVGVDDGLTVVGRPVVGAAVEGAAVEGAAVVGAAVVGRPVVGAPVDGASVEGDAVVGDPVVGTAVEGAAVVGVAVGAGVYECARRTRRSSGSTAARRRACSSTTPVSSRVFGGYCESVSRAGYLWGVSESGCGTTYDPTERPWYVMGATGPKDAGLLLFAALYAAARARP